MLTEHEIKAKLNNNYKEWLDNLKQCQVEEIFVSECKEKDCDCDCDCDEELEETSAEHEGKKVTLNKPFRLSDGEKKFGVYVKDGDKVKKVTFGDPNMEIKRDDDEARSSFRARHKCDQQKDKTSAAYWSCKMWEKDKSVSDVTEETLDVYLNEDTDEHYYIELCEETLQERKIVIRINSKGERIRRIKCPPGRVVKTVNGRRVCVTPTGREKLTKKLAIKRAVRNKKAKGAGYKKRVNFRRQRALRKRRQMFGKGK